MKRGDLCQAEYGQVRITGADSNGFPCVYVSGIFDGKPARIPRQYLKLVAGRSRGEGASGRAQTSTVRTGVTSQPAGRTRSREPAGGSGAPV